MGHVPVGPGRTRVFRAGLDSTTSPFSGLFIFQYGGVHQGSAGDGWLWRSVLVGRLLFFPCNFIFSSSPLVACGWSTLNGAGLISLIKIGLLQSSRGGGGKNRAASGPFFPPPPPRPCRQSREARPGSGTAFLLLRDSPRFGVYRSKPVCFLFQGLIFVGAWC